MEQSFMRELIKTYKSWLNWFGPPSDVLPSVWNVNDVCFQISLDFSDYVFLLWGGWRFQNGRRDFAMSRDICMSEIYIKHPLAYRIHNLQYQWGSSCISHADIWLIDNNLINAAVRTKTRQSNIVVNLKEYCCDLYMDYEMMKRLHDYQ